MVGMFIIHIAGENSMGEVKYSYRILVKKKLERKKVCAKYRHSGISRVKYTLKIGYQAGGLIHLAPYRTHYQDLMNTV